MITLDSNVRFIKGVGPARTEQFNKIGVRTVRDLLQYYPRDYAFVKACSIADAKLGDFVLIRGEISHASKYGGPRHAVRVNDGTGSILCVWFGGYVAPVLRKTGVWLTLWGKVSEYSGRLQLSSPKYCEGETPGGLGCVVTYPATKLLPSTVIAKVIGQILDGRLQLHEEQEYVKGMMRRPRAISVIHRPENREELKRARERLVYDEFLHVFREMKKRRISSTHYATDPVRFGEIIRDRILKLFSFRFTHGQELAIGDVIHDMSTSEPMYRLLQGDVGSGKTAVAVYASILAAISGKQTVVVVPTQILAHQHFDEWDKYLCGSQYKVCLLTSDTMKTTSIRNMTLDMIAHGGYDVIIATTSVLSDKMKFKDLGLLIVDEQHRFGVKQKYALVEKYHPNQLYMSATPIPRALSLTAFGDLDISLIDEMPYGRGSRLTQVVLPQDLDAFRDSMEGVIANGYRVYEVFPRIHGAGGLEEGRLAAAYGTFRAVVHGERKSAHNATALDSFRRGEVNHLMCTSMVEVGMHVEGANHMVIHEAEMFGLSQLHQMRGRIGRGSESSYCYLLLNSDNPDSHDKLRFLETTDDGFEVAQKDLEMRGPGQFIGTVQHGMPEFKLADLVSDYKILLRAKGDIDAV